MQSMNKITFFSRFETDILNGKKTITIRDQTEAYFQPQQRLDVFTNETDRLFAHIEIISVTPIRFDELNERHAMQENMPLDQLKQLIREIYPQQDTFFVIEFKLINEPI